MAKPAIDSVSDYMNRGGANLHGVFPTSIETVEVLHDTRQAMADFLGPEADEVAFGAHYVVNHTDEVPFRLLERIPDASVGEDSGNAIVYGDNLEALKAFLPYYRERVKLVYIDPPYNTGNEDWIYNDRMNAPKIKAWPGKVVSGEGEDRVTNEDSRYKEARQ